MTDRCITREHCCSFTGHRPEKLREPEDRIKALLRDGISEAIADGYWIFATGMAKGAERGIRSDTQ